MSIFTNYPEVIIQQKYICIHVFQTFDLANISLLFTKIVQRQIMSFFLIAAPTEYGSSQARD